MKHSGNLSPRRRAWHAKNEDENLRPELTVGASGGTVAPPPGGTRAIEIDDLFAPKRGHLEGSRKESAFDPKRTFSRTIPLEA